LPPIDGSSLAVKLNDHELTAVTAYFRLRASLVIVYRWDSSACVHLYWFSRSTLPVVGGHCTASATHGWH